ncbi:MAG: hypothetical protein CMJ83_06545 [Planctomycetes bacterium]|nr:hypothetical protein [Planctomycetota bacterium]
MTVDPNVETQGWWVAGGYSPLLADYFPVQPHEPDGGVAFWVPSGPVMCGFGPSRSCSIVLRRTPGGSPNAHVRVGLYFDSGQVDSPAVAGRVTVSTGDWSRPGRIRGIYEIDGWCRGGFDIENPFVR